jgi:hypothetical protein
VDAQLEAQDGEPGEGADGPWCPASWPEQLSQALSWGCWLLAAVAAFGPT